MMDVLGDWLYQVSTALLVPVVALLLALLAVVLFGLGRFLREMLGRSRTAAARRALREDLLAGSTERDQALRALGSLGSGSTLLARFARDADRCGATNYHLDALVAECEIQGSRIAARTSWIARSGPVLGLVGTLIPMGPALIELSEGDLAALSRSLVVAFTTTVVGLLVGWIAASMASVQRLWYASDVALVEHLAAYLVERGR